MGIERYDVNENWAHTGIIKAGDFYFISYCVGNIDSLLKRRLTVRLTRWKTDLNQSV